MKPIALMSVILAGLSIIPAWAEMGCKAVQVTCLPELGTVETRVVAYDDTKSCQHSPTELKSLAAKGVYPLTDKDAEVATAMCNLGVGAVKLTVDSYVENKNVQGQCGAYGPVPVIGLWVNSVQVAEKLPLQSCYHNYDAQELRLIEGGQGYSVQFGGNIAVERNFYLFNPQNIRSSPKLPITRETLTGDGAE